MEIQKKTYIRGHNNLEKLQNLMKVAETLYHGNWSAMVLESVIARHDLDPETCAPKSGVLQKLDCCPPKSSQ